MQRILGGLTPLLILVLLTGCGKTVARAEPLTDQAVAVIMESHLPTAPLKTTGGSSSAVKSATALLDEKTGGTLTLGVANFTEGRLIEDPAQCVSVPACKIYSKAGEEFMLTWGNAKGKEPGGVALSTTRDRRIIFLQYNATGYKGGIESKQLPVPLKTMEAMLLDERFQAVQTTELLKQSRAYSWR